MKPSIRFGLINGGVGIIWSLLMYVTTLNRNPSFQWINMIGLAFTIMFMVMAINEYRTKIGNGWVSFGAAFKQAFIVGIIGSVIGLSFYYVYLTAIDPGFVEFQMQMQVDRLAESGLSEEAITSQVEQIGKFMTPGMQVIFGMVFSVFISAVFALIVAAIKKHPNPEEIA